MRRILTPELLDSLPPDSPAARHSRRDLRLFNRVLGADYWWRTTLPPLLTATAPGLELGAGDGRLAATHGLAALDLAPPPATWPGHLSWHRADARAFDRWTDYPLVVANLFLHHLSANDLATLGHHLSTSARIIVACEPRRAPGFRTGFALLCHLIHAHPVSRHDGRVSIEAGFRCEELPELLGLSRRHWTWHIRHHPLGTYRFVARRSGP